MTALDTTSPSPIDAAMPDASDPSVAESRAEVPVPAASTLAAGVSPAAESPSASASSHSPGPATASVAESSPAPATGTPVAELTIIRATRGWIGIDWSELWRFRELLYFLVWRDFKVRYKQTTLGVAWAVLQPVFTMVVFTIIFGHLAHLASDGFPYAVFVYAGLLPWTFFAASVNLAGLSLVNQQNLLTKVYFPRLFVPAASVGAGLVDLAISFGVYAIILAWYRFVPSWQVVYLPALVLLTLLATLGAGLLLAAVTVSYRDFRFVIPFMLQAMMYISPVVYSTKLIPPRYDWLLALNPMAGIIDAYRSAILGKPWNLTTLSVSTASTLVLFVYGLFYFRKTERKFADIA
jgi:lipopolysaccharide transport system permease protein